MSFYSSQVNSHEWDNFDVRGGGGGSNKLISTTYFKRLLGRALIFIILATLFPVINSQKWQEMQCARD